MLSGSSGHCEAAGYRYTDLDWVLDSLNVVGEAVLVKWRAALLRSTWRNPSTKEGQDSQRVGAGMTYGLHVNSGLINRPAAENTAHPWVVWRHPYFCPNDYNLSELEMDPIITECSVALELLGGALGL